MSAANLKNPWLNSAKSRQLLEDLDEHIMNGWASDATLGELINSLPNELRDFFLNMKFSSPLETDKGFDLSFNSGE
jgi:hypothetical protein